MCSNEEVLNLLLLSNWSVISQVFLILKLSKSNTLDSAATTSRQQEKDEENRSHFENGYICTIIGYYFVELVRGTYSE